ncbi:MAG: hypothetical protein K0S32_235 [Bacteroidetes bacterium]|jgi:hypothetical protein|nr:hypothetical protein [Bacteroidota bacterium]
MSDDKNKTQPQDAGRINIHEEYEVNYWIKKFNCTRDELIHAVNAVGTSSEEVEENLKNR